MKDNLLMVALTAAGVVVGGMLLYYGRELPGFKQAHLGFDRAGA